MKNENENVKSLMGMMEKKEAVEVCDEAISDGDCKCVSTVSALGLAMSSFLLRLQARVYWKADTIEIELMIHYPL